MRKRKEGRFLFWYIEGMEATVNKHWTAEQVMKTYPQTISIFIALKTNCVGCHLERFCTLEEVADAYSMSLEMLLAELRAASQP